MAPVPLVTAALLVGLYVALNALPSRTDRFCWVPFARAVGLFLLGFYLLAYSFFPYVLPEQLSVWQAAAAPEALLIMFVGAIIVLPIITPVDGLRSPPLRVGWPRLSGAKRSPRAAPVPLCSQ